MNTAVATTLMGGICTLAIFSFLIKENKVYRIFEHAFIGIATGLGAVLTFRYFLWPKILEPMLGFNTITFPDGSIHQPYQPLYLIYLIPMAFGLLYYTIYSKRLSWLAKLVIGFSLGSGAGLAFKGFFAEMIPQLQSSFKPLVVFSAENGIDWWGSISNCIFVFTLLAVMYYFFFTVKSESKASTKISKSGRWLMMLCFGAFFGSTVMARLALLVERIQFLLIDWSSAVVNLI